MGSFCQQSSFSLSAFFHDGAFGELVCTVNCTEVPHDYLSTWSRDHTGQNYLAHIVYTSIPHTLPLPYFPLVYLSTNLQPATVTLMVPMAPSVSHLVGSAPVTSLHHLRMWPAQTDSAASVLSTTMGPPALGARVSTSLKCTVLHIYSHLVVIPVLSCLQPVDVPLLTTCVTAQVGSVAVQ